MEYHARDYPTTVYRYLMSLHFLASPEEWERLKHDLPTETDVVPANIIAGNAPLFQGLSVYIDRCPCMMLPITGKTHDIIDPLGAVKSEEPRSHGPDRHTGRKARLRSLWKKLALRRDQRCP